MKNIEYVKGKPYFLDTKQKIKKFPYLSDNIECDVLIIGGGIDGSIANYYFSNAEIDCVLIEKSRIGYTSTSCATALLEYQMDEHANALTKYFEKEIIVDIYRISLSVLDELDKLIKKHGNHCHYSRRDSIVFSLEESDKAELEREFVFRKQNNFDVEFLDESSNPFEFNVKTGIYAKNGGAEFNPYLFTKMMIDNSNSKFSRIYEHTEAKEIIKTNDGTFKVITNYGIEIKCKKIICSTGYNTSWMTPRKLCDKFISYTIVTNPCGDFSWENRALLHDNSNPYHYIRLSPDNRIIIGGEDIPFKGDEIDEKMAEKKYNLLLDFAKKLFPSVANELQIDYKFCGTFSATSNNLAVIGESMEDENIWYFFGYGANGIVYCVYGAKMLLDKYKGIYSPFEKYFSPKRQLP